MHFISVLTTYTGYIESVITHGGYALLFMFTIMEGIPVLGMIVPGHIAVIAAGFIARMGTLDLGWVIVIATAGAIIGDYIGFYIGRKYGIVFINWLRPYFPIVDEYLDKTRALLNKHTGKAMIIGRFTPATRSLMPFVVGTMNTSVSRFWFFNIIGGVSWVITSIMLGYIFGAGYHVAARYFGRFFLFALIATFIIIWGYRFVNRYFHIFKRYELFTLALNISSLLVFAVTVDKLTSNSFKLSFDVWVSNFMCNWVHPIGACFGTITPDSPLSASGSIIVGIAYWITTLGGTASLIGIGVLISLWLAYKKKWRSATIMFLAIGSTGMSLLFLKNLFNIARPEFALQSIIGDPSFPSGHAGVAAMFFVVIIYLLAPKIDSWIRRESMIVVSAILVILIGLSRLVLNVHWASDVVAGWSLGIFMATASILLVRYVSSIFIKGLK